MEGPARGRAGRRVADRRVASWGGEGTAEGEADDGRDGPVELRVEGLAISRDDLVLARDVSFALAGGEALVVTGENGSGKSTLLRALMGLARRDAGDVRLVMSGQEIDLPRHTHLLGHHNAMKPDLTVRENLTFWARLLESGAAPDATGALPDAPGAVPDAQGAVPDANGAAAGPDTTGGMSGEVAALIAEAAGPLGLERLLDLPFAYLSAGQGRRAALARLWVAPRPVWLLDEPTAALDTASALAVRDMIEAHRAEGGVVIAATHVDLGLPVTRSLRLGEAAERERRRERGRDG